MARLPGQIGFVFKKRKCVPAKADAGVQQAFLDTVLAPLMQAAGPQAPLSFVDGCHPSDPGSLLDHALFVSDTVLSRADALPLCR